MKSFPAYSTSAQPVLMTAFCPEAIWKLFGIIHLTVLYGQAYHLFTHSPNLFLKVTHCPTHR